MSSHKTNFIRTGVYIRFFLLFAVGMLLLLLAGPDGRGICGFFSAVFFSLSVLDLLISLIVLDEYE